MAEKMLKNLPEITEVEDSHQFLTWLGDDSARRISVNNLAKRLSGVKEQSLSDNGYMKFNNGLIIQWGEVILDDNTTQKTFPLPTPFTIASYGVFVSRVNGGKSYFAYFNNLGNITVGENSGYNRDPIMWFAIGR